MVGSKKRVFLTGATGNMGREAVRLLVERSDRVTLRILVRPEERDHPLVRRWARTGMVEIQFGDLTEPADVEIGVRDSDVVLHVGGMVSPQADRFPELTEKVNVGAAINIVNAIRTVDGLDRIRLVYIGTVAQTGSRMPPIHWGRTGDPIKISKYDHYAVTKTKAEAIIADSGIARWASLRQSGMANLAMLKIFDPIMFHNPINGVFEWSTARDSGRLMANICEDDVPEQLWRNFYNIGGGSESRVTNHEFMSASMAAIGVRDFRVLFPPNLFATRNFHGQWYSDSSKLESLVPFRSQTIRQFLDEAAGAASPFVKLISRWTPSLIRSQIDKLARSPGGPLYWLEQSDQEHLNAYFGSLDAWRNIPSWDRFEFTEPSKEPHLLDHGYDESRSEWDWSAADLTEAACFRGGHFVGPVTSPFERTGWECAQGHSFSASPNLVLRGGHWCPTCMFDVDRYDRLATDSPFFAQAWNHGC
jgi:nucleoside-diphosphate-sugar epimerase